MNPSDWLRVEEIFHRAADLQGAARQAFLDQECRGAEQMRREVESLIEVEESGCELFAQPLMASLDLGTRIGPYELVRELGRGGMGTVYLAAHEDDTGDPRVAIKVINRGMDTPLAVSRFAQERRTLSSLDHPHIAHFLGGGVMEDGRPYLVMEYIDGEPIDLYCDRQRLSIEERLRLFLEVCDAIHHAHQRLFVHRDLKPTNIVVSKGGVAKVLDFGTAKLLDPAHRMGGVASTAMGLSLLTPGYASPEQVRGEAIDTLTDVYGLGLLLYELLTGSRAYRIDEANPIHLVRAVCEEEPIKPSSIVGRATSENSSQNGSRETSVSQAPSIAELRSAQPVRLRRSLEGDLDKIVLMALRKEPHRRYGSVARLAEDIERHLQGRPVKANRGSFPYRARKFARRYRTLLTAASVAFLSVLLFAGSLFRQVSQTERQRDRAELEREKAEHVSTFLVDLFERVDTGADQEAGPGARALLDRGAAKVLRASRQPPELRAHLLAALGTGYRKMALFDEALPLLEEARKLSEGALGPNHLDTAASLHNLGVLHLDLARFEEADELMTTALEIRQAQLGSQHETVAESLGDLAELQFRLGNLDSAEQLVRSSLATRRALLEDDNLLIASSLHSLGNVLESKGDHQGALTLLTEVLEIRQRLQGPEAADLGAAFLDLGSVYRSLGQLDRAEASIEQSLVVQTKALGKEHPYVGYSLHALGSILSERGDFQRAATLMRQAIGVLDKVLEPDHPDLSMMTFSLGKMYFRAGELDQATVLLEQALGLQESGLGVDHPSIAFTVYFLAAISRQQGDFLQAESFLQRAVHIRRTRDGPDHLNLAFCLNALAQLYLEEYQFRSAEPLLREALSIRQRALGPESELVVATLKDLARAVEGNSRTTSVEAAELLERAGDVRNL